MGNEIVAISTILLQAGGAGHEKEIEAVGDILLQVLGTGHVLTYFAGVISGLGLYKVMRKFLT